MFCCFAFVTAQRYIVTPALPQLRAVETRNQTQRTALDNLAAQLEGTIPTATLGYRHFYDSDFSVYRTPNFTLSVRMFSNRTVNARCVNDEALQSQHSADGMTALYYTGGEYDGIFPLWDWMKLPGTTIEQNTGPLNCQNTLSSTTEHFVGGATDGALGLMAGRLSSHSLKVQKSWLFFDATMFALGSSLTVASGNPEVTTLESTRGNGNVTVALQSGSITSFPLGTQASWDVKDLAWLHHGHTGFAFPDTPLASGRISLIYEVGLGVRWQIT